MTSCILLSIAGSTAGIERIDYVALSSIHRQRVVSFQCSIDRAGSSIVIDQHRIFLGRIELRRQVVPTLYDCTVRSRIVPVACRCEIDIGQLLGGQIPYEFSFGPIEPIESVSIVGTLAAVPDSTIISCHTEPLYYILSGLNLTDLKGFQIQPIELLARSVFSPEVIVVVFSVESPCRYTGVEILGQGCCFPCGEIEQEELLVVRIGSDSRFQVQSYIAESICRTHYDQMFAVGCILDCVDGRIASDKRIRLARLHIVLHDSGKAERTARPVRGERTDQSTLTIRCNIIYIGGRIAECQRTVHTALGIQQIDLRTIPPIRLSVVRIQMTDKERIFSGAFLLFVEKIIARIGRHPELRFG